MSFDGSKSRAGGVPSLKLFLASGAAAVLVASCASNPGPTGTPYPPLPTDTRTTVAPPPPPATQTADGLTPQFMAGRNIARVGLLLPFTSRPEEAHALYQAAELGVFDFGGSNTLLIPRESGATPEEAAANAKLLLRDGVDVILGPIERDQVASAGAAARAENVPVIGFSSDREVAGNGIYILSLTLDEEVRRIVDFAASKGLRNIALLAPNNDYGRRVEAAMRASLATKGALVDIEFYERTEQAAAGAARSMARRVRGTNTQAIMIADNGSTLRATGPALLVGGVTPGRIQLLGTGAWAGSDSLREPTLAGGWYPAPDPELRAKFEDRYRETYGRAPSRFASFGYDGVMIASLLGQNRRNGVVPRSSVERADGFAGADGVARFRPDGSLERGLAILEVGPGGVEIVDPAPRSLRGS